MNQSIEGVNKGNLGSFEDDQYMIVEKVSRISMDQGIDNREIKNSINFETVQNTEWDHDNEVETSS